MVCGNGTCYEAPGSDAVTAVAKSTRAFVSGWYLAGTDTSTLAIRPVVVNRYPAESCSGYQSTPLIVINSLVGVRPAGWSTPHRSVMGGEPQAAVVLI